MPGAVRVLVVDDSAVVRKILSTGLAGDPEIDVVGTAVDPYDARDKIVKLSPDVLTLDVEMPRMDGVEFLRRIMPRRPIPAVMVSALTQRGAEITLQALDAGAIDFVTKPSQNVARGLELMLTELRHKVKVASRANVQRWKSKSATPVRPPPSSTALANTTDKVVIIGASTGGTEAIREVLMGLPATGPGVVIVQHMPKQFTAMFAERLDTLCEQTVTEAKSGDRVLPGHVLIAPGDSQLQVTRFGGQYRVKIGGSQTVCGHCPSVEVLMNSAAKAVGANAVGVMLTGMGGDGAGGMLAMRNAGAQTIAQDQETCVVFGMPREAHRNGGAQRLVPLQDIASSVMGCLRRLEAA